MKETIIQGERKVLNSPNEFPSLRKSLQMKQATWIPVTHPMLATARVVTAHAQKNQSCHMKQLSNTSYSTLGL